MRLVTLALLLMLTACGPRHPRVDVGLALPDTIYTASGATPVVLVDSIATPDPSRLILGQYDYLKRTVFISRVVRDAMARRKVAEHERCHIVFAESGIQMHFADAPWLLELTCDAFANAAMSQLERGKP